MTTLTPKDIVVLKLSPELKGKHASDYAAVRGSNIRSISMERFRRKMMRFLDVAFGEGERK